MLQSHIIIVVLLHLMRQQQKNRTRYEELDKRKDFNYQDLIIICGEENLEREEGI